MPAICFYGAGHWARHLLPPYSMGSWQQSGDPRKVTHRVDGWPRPLAPCPPCLKAEPLVASECLSCPPEVRGPSLAPASSQVFDFVEGRDETVLLGLSSMGRSSEAKCWWALESLLSVRRCLSSGSRVFSVFALLLLSGTVLSLGRDHQDAERRRSLELPAQLACPRSA